MRASERKVGLHEKPPKTVSLRNIRVENEKVLKDEVRNDRAQPGTIPLRGKQASQVNPSSSPLRSRARFDSSKKGNMMDASAHERSDPELPSKEDSWIWTRTPQGVYVVLRIVKGDE